MFLLKHDTWCISIHQNDPTFRLVPAKWNHINIPLKWVEKLLINAHFASVGEKLAFDKYYYLLYN